MDLTPALLGDLRLAGLLAGGGDLSVRCGCARRSGPVRQPGDQLPAAWRWGLGDVETTGGRCARMSSWRLGDTSPGQVKRKVMKCNQCNIDTTCVFSKTKHFTYPK